MKTKYLAVAASLIAVLLTGCGSDKAEQKSSNLPQAAPAQQVQQLQPDKVLSKGKIVGTTKTAKGEIVEVEEREVETYGVGDKRIVEKRYYKAGTDTMLPGYEASLKYKDKKIENKGESLPQFKSH